MTNRLLIIVLIQTCLLVPASLYAQQSDWGKVAKGFAKGTAGFHDPIGYAIDQQVASEVEAFRNNIRRRTKWKFDQARVNRKLGNVNSVKYRKLMDGLPVVLSFESIGFTIDQFGRDKLTPDAVGYLRSNRNQLQDFFTYAKAASAASKRDQISDIDKEYFQSGLSNSEVIVSDAIEGFFQKARNAMIDRELYSSIIRVTSQARKSVWAALLVQLQEESLSDELDPTAIQVSKTIDNPRYADVLWLRNTTNRPLRHLTVIVAWDGEGAPGNYPAGYYVEEFPVGNTNWIRLPGDLNLRIGRKPTAAPIRILVADDDGLVMDTSLVIRAGTRVDTVVPGSMKVLLDSWPIASDGEEILDAAIKSVSNHYKNVKAAGKVLRDDLKQMDRDKFFKEAHDTIDLIKDEVKLKNLPSQDANILNKANSLDGIPGRRVRGAISRFDSSVLGSRLNLVRSIDRHRQTAKALGLVSSEKRLSNFKDQFLKVKPLETIEYRDILAAKDSESSPILEAYKHFAKYVELNEARIGRIEKGLLRSIKSKAKDRELEESDMEDVAALQQQGELPEEYERELDAIGKLNLQFNAALQQLIQDNPQNDGLEEAVEMINARGATYYNELFKKQ